MKTYTLKYLFKYFSKEGTEQKRYETNKNK